MIKTLFTFVTKFLSLKNVLRIIFLYLTGLVIRFVLIKYCNVDVFHDYASLYSNLYYVLMAILSVLTLEISNFIPNWTYIFECVKIFTKHYLGGKMVLMDHNSGSYGDISSIGRKSVYSMNNNSSDSSSDSSSSSRSSSSRPLTDAFLFDGNETEMERLNVKIDILESRIQRFSGIIGFLNSPEIRSIASKIDYNRYNPTNMIPLTTREQEWWNWVRFRSVRNPHSFDHFSFFYGSNSALDSEINRKMSYIHSSSHEIRQYRGRIQAIIAETQGNETSQNQGANANNSNNNN